MIILGGNGLNGQPFINVDTGRVDIGAFPIGTPASVGSRISGKSFTKRDCDRELARIFEEDRLEDEDRVKLYKAALAERALSSMQRAERDLKLAEVHCVDCEKTFRDRPLKLNHDRLIDAQNERDQLIEHIEELHEQKILDRISKGEKITDPKIAKQLAAANRELIKLKGDKKHQRRIDQLNTEIYRLRLHG